MGNQMVSPPTNFVPITKVPITKPNWSTIKKDVLKISIKFIKMKKQRGIRLGEEKDKLK